MIIDFKPCACSFSTNNLLLISSIPSSILVLVLYEVNAPILEIFPRTEGGVMPTEELDEQTARI